MRKLLLATVAISFVGVGSAMAASQSVQISATVTAACSVTDPLDVSFGANPVPGATANRLFSFTCNFAGDNGSTLTIGFASTNGGLNNPGDPDPTREYKVTYAATDYLASAIFPVGITVPETSTAPATANNRNFDVTLVDTLTVAGTYADTLVVSVAP